VISITSYGFKYLLLSLRTQVITLIYHVIVWLDLSQHVPISTSLIFVASLSEYQPCDSILIESPGINQNQIFIRMLREIGLVYMKKSTSKSFLVTKIIVNLVLSNDYDIDNQSINETGIVVESNFRVYAYNVTQLQLSLIALFSEVFAFY
ncbi:hypothetical protein MXB_4244, partial [Myxobolus squamalis]